MINKIILSIIWQGNVWFQQENSIYESSYLEDYTRGLYFLQKLKEAIIFFFSQ